MTRILGWADFSQIAHFSPPLSICSLGELADLYDPLAMPADLRKATRRRRKAGTELKPRAFAFDRTE